ncbi:glycerol-3-phosphate acyltransferase 3-like, partial [Centruroides vittatus]|uniref:glycerol-3-phosphate acyltransferase 3-like n=1 Tax=Centruroides vittatus TaxID=120091 RepID=UPI00350F8DC8
LLIFLTLAAMGASLGIRGRYVKLLLKVFEYGQRKIEKAEMINHGIKTETEYDNAPDSFNFQMSNGSNTVISRECVQLVPNPEQMKGSISRNGSFNTFQTKFKLDDGLHFIKAAIEAIIEHELTKRFTFEKIRSWNLLTRSNKNYHYKAFADIVTCHNR